MTNWLHEAICDNKTGLASSTRIVMLMSALTLCLSTIWLTVIVFWKTELVSVLVAFGSGLSVMSTGGYVAGRFAGQKDAEK